MNPDSEEWDEERFSSLLQSTQKETTPVDREFLAALREQSAAEFLAAGSKSQARPQRSPRMPVGRSWTLFVAAASLLVVGLLFLFTRPQTDVTFAAALDTMSAAETLHLQVSQDGRTEDVWVQQPGRLRWDHTDGTYSVALGDEQWLVDERANSAARKPSAYFSDDQNQVDLLAMLDVSDIALRDRLLKSNPVETTRLDGREVDIYRVQSMDDDGRVELQAVVDHLRRTVQSLEVTVDQNGGRQSQAKLSLIALNEPVDENKFLVSGTLTEDGRVGRVSDVQGIVSVRPVMRKRWTPVCSQILLKPGDWLRTDVRGANAVAIRLMGQKEITLGPGSLVEIIKPNRLRLIKGELQINTPDDSAIELIGPDDKPLAVKGKRFYRLAKTKLVAVKTSPKWLTGFEGTTSNESLGSLIATVNGQNVPLTVGDHKVTVDIRDQIARTVIEESFVNHTKSRLEGVFYFPLPQDASISGFGMWIGGELVEADLVEKQRAREIYETILRERRDPGLLEWAGGNIFKARVFPIEANSEKRIKITYTQVLPMKGNRYRYSYGLRSEMLKENPLKQLEIDVKIYSALPLKKVTSVTHPTRNDQTENSAHVEFSAQEYTPTRDFEVSIEVDQRQSDVVVIPHRRGDDGYFMLQFMPPGGGNWQREILPDGDPLELLILADTSASLDRTQRETQAEFLAALFSALTPRDKINVAGCDVDCNWVFQKAKSADEQSIAAVRKFLDSRVSLGWSDLDKAFASALKQAGPKTHVIYVGDGIVTTAPRGYPADPVAFTNRLRRLYVKSQTALHAVSIDSSFEPMVMNAISRQGGGTVRQIGGERTPQKVALSLLSEVAQPALRNLRIEFRGLQTARVYPDRLANLPAGSQQIVLGRYLPDGEDQTGEVVITAEQGDKTVRFSTRITLKDAEQGNSFIPRLWSRLHIDALLRQGASAEIRDDIIALSEEYHIMTPYTSLLVLETDADRERFGIKRRFQMRDGEKFFAEGRKNVDYELVQQQMKRAGNWRLGLQRQVLKYLATLARDANMLQLAQQLRLRESVSEYGDSITVLAGISGGGYGNLRPESVITATNGGFDLASGSVDLYSLDGKEGGERYQSMTRDFNGRNFPVDQNAPAGEWVDGRADKEDLSFSDEEAGEFLENYDSDEDGDGIMAERKLLIGNKQLPFFGKDRQLMPYESRSRGQSFGVYRPNQGTTASSQYISWLNSLFPGLSAAVTKQPKELKSTWPQEARDLANSLLRLEKLQGMTGGVEIVRRRESYDVRFGDVASRSTALELYSPKSWLTRTGGGYSQILVNWANEKERGVLGRAYQLGRTRDSVPHDLQTPRLSLVDYSLNSLERTYRAYKATVQRPADDRAVLVLTYGQNGQSETRVLIDTEKNVILSIENRRGAVVGRSPDRPTARHQAGRPSVGRVGGSGDPPTTSVGKLRSKVAFSDFVQVADSWWAQRMETTNAEGRRSTLITQTVKVVAADAYAKRIQPELADRDRVQFIRQPFVKLKIAKRAMADERATFDDRLRLLLHFAGSQQWERVFAHLQAMEQLAADKPGMRWVRNALLMVSRRHEELRKRLMAEATRLTGAQDKEHKASELFLTDQLVTQAHQILQTREMLTLNGTLKPIYERQPALLAAMKRWKDQQAGYLSRAGQPGDALKLRRELAVEYPRDYNSQQQYARALVETGDYTAAYAWLTKVLVKEAKWRVYEENSLRNVYLEFLERQGRFVDMADYLEGRQKENPTAGYDRYLNALIRSNQVDKAHETLARWLQEGRIDGELKPPALARLNAAVALALGQGYSLYTNRIEKRWLEPLAETALFFARHKNHAAVADRIMNQYQFRQTDQCRRIRKRIMGVLSTELAQLTAEQIGRFIGWISANDPTVEKELWTKIAAELQKRWSAETDKQIKQRLANSLIRVLRGYIGTTEHLAFLRLQLKAADVEQRAGFARQLFDVLLSQSWQEVYETEAFSLLERLSDADEPAAKLAAQVQALYRLTDRMVQARQTALMAAIKNQHELKRKELQEKKTETLRKARSEFAARLAEQSNNRPQPLAQWFAAERLYLHVRLNHELDKIAAECWKLLGNEPPKPLAEDAEPDPGRHLQSVLKLRMQVTLMNLAVRKTAQPQAVNRLLAYFDKGIAANTETGLWKMPKYQLLVALDRPQELKPMLSRWVRTEDPDNVWRMALGYLHAELGEIAEGIKLLEAVQAADELGPKDYRALADWYMVVDRREDYERAMIAMYKTTQEWRLSNWLSTRLNPWQRSSGQLPTELDEQVLLVFRALFEKSGSPQSYLRQLREFYRSTRDFRLLAVLPDAVIGHTAGKVYPFLQGMTSVLGEVRDEATADSIVERLQEVRKSAKSAIDHRALDLLELLVERRSSELLNQPGPHASKAMAAMQRAFDRKWTDGEPRLMADFLAGLGRMTQQPLKREQLRELQMLHDREDKGTVDRLHIANRWASTQWNYAQNDTAIDRLQSALDEYVAAVGGTLPVHARNPFQNLVNYFNSRRHYVRAESMLHSHLDRPANQQQAFWLKELLYQVYENALHNGGEVSVGKGRMLYQQTEKMIQSDMLTVDQNHRYTLLNRLCSLYRVAKDKKLPGVAADLHRFAFEKLPGILKQQTNSYTSMVQAVSYTIRDVSGKRDALEFLIVRIENEPAWFHYAGQDGWAQHASTIGYWRRDVAVLGNDLEARLLKIVLAELRKDLQTRQRRNRSMYHSVHGSYFWKQKKADFARTAEEVLAEQKTSGAAVKYIAEYFFRGLAMYDRAIEIMFLAHQDGLLDESGQWQLVNYLHNRSRYGESITLLRPLIKRSPSALHYRTHLMIAFYNTKRQSELLATLKEADEFFHQENRWQENPMAVLAKTCLDTKLYEQSVAYYKEAIPLHERTHARRGIGNGALSRYYGNQARAYSGLGKTAEAVDAAAAAIVAWGPRHENRENALEALRQVLRESPDLNGYVAQRNRQLEEHGQVSSIVRKAIGFVYFEKREYNRALTELKLAVENQPNDRKTHEKLIACYQQMKDNDGLIRQYLDLLELSRRDIDLYGSLAEHLKDAAQRERAYTSIVDALPHESESHAKLAEVREKQNRWSDAARHWRQVARIRELEPTGLLRLAAAQIQLKKWQDADTTLDKLESHGWPSRFDNIGQQTRELRRKVQSARKL